MKSLFGPRTLGSVIQAHGRSGHAIREATPAPARATVLADGALEDAAADAPRNRAASCDSSRSAGRVVAGPAIAGRPCGASHDILSSGARHALDFDVLSRGRSLFAQGYELDRIGATDAADQLYRKSIEQIEAHLAEHGASPASAEFGRTALQHGVALYRIGRIESARAAIARAVELFEICIQGDTSVHAIKDLATALSWHALAQRSMGEYEGASQSYVRAIGYWRSIFKLFGAMLGTTDVRQSLAVNLIGLSKSLRAQGDERGSALYLQESQDILNLCQPPRIRAAIH